MSMTETLDDLTKLELSRFERLTTTNLENPIVPVIECPMTVQSKVALNAPDRLLFRLNKLLAPTKDLGSVLTTFNYGLYLLAYLDAKAHTLKSKALSLVTPEAALKTLSANAEAESSPFARLGSIVANARTTLRLFGLLPIYVRARKLMNDSKGMDHVLYFIAVVQCSLFATFQFLENVAFLTENGVLSKRGLGRWTAGAAGGRVATLYKVAHRVWFLGIMCDFARLVREAQIFFQRIHIEKGELSEEEAEKAAQWYYDWIRPLAWLPIGWQLSAWTEEGVGRFNLGVQGIAGVLADLKRTATLWHATGDA